MILSHRRLFGGLLVDDRIQGMAANGAMLGLMASTDSAISYYRKSCCKSWVWKRSTAATLLCDIDHYTVGLDQFQLTELGVGRFWDHLGEDSTEGRKAFDYNETRELTLSFLSSGQH